jgi:hypothetical protein
VSAHPPADRPRAAPPPPLSAAGAATGDEAVAIIDPVTKIQGHFWNSEVLQLPMLTMSGRWNSAPSWAMWCEGALLQPDLAASQTSLIETLRAKYKQDDTFFNIDEYTGSETFKYYQECLGDRDKVTVLLERIITQIDSRPKTFLHGDLRSDNIFRSTSDPDDFA